MNCTKCGKELRAGLKFCPGCGSPVAPRAPQPAQQPAPQQPAAPVAGKQLKKPLTQKELPDWNPPKPAAPPSRFAEGPAHRPESAAEKFKSSFRKLSEKIPRPKPGAEAASTGIRGKIKIPGAGLSLPMKIIVPAVALLAIATAAFFLIKGCGHQDKPASAVAPGRQPVVPPGYKHLDMTVNDVMYETRVNIQVEIGKNPNKDDIRKNLDVILEYWKKQKGFINHRHPTVIVIRAYANEQIFKLDPEWWVARLYWAEGMKPEFEYNEGGLMPRFKAMGYGGQPRDEYLRQGDKLTDAIKEQISELKKIIKDYETMAIDDTALREKAVPITKELFDLTAPDKIPEAPWNDCAELDRLLKITLNDAMAVQEYFDPDARLAGDTRLDLKYVHQLLDTFDINYGYYSSERRNYDE